MNTATSSSIPTASVSATLAVLQQRLGAHAPKIAVLLGSGWHPFADAVQDAVTSPMPTVDAPDHAFEYRYAYDPSAHRASGRAAPARDGHCNRRTM